MKITIIRETNTVAVGGAHFEIGAVALLPKDIHAVQWDTDTKRGEIEYVFKVCDHCGAGSKKPNTAITDFTPYQPLLDAWTAAKAAADAEAERLKAEQEARELAAKHAENERIAALARAEDAEAAKVEE
jgi:hypothetical protein